MSTNRRVNRKVQLQSSDGAIFEVDISVVQHSVTLTDIIEVTGSESTIPLPQVSRNILAKVIEYYAYHWQFEQITDEKPAATEDEIKQRDAEFLQVDHGTLVGLINAAHYLNMKNLLDLTCQRAADMITGKTPAEIRRIFGMVNHYDPEEEAQMRREIEWIFHYIASFRL